VIRSASGELRGAEMGEFEDAGESLGELIAATVFLPSNMGGMLKGIPDSSADALKEPVADVVNQAVWQRAVFTQHGTEIQASILLPSGETQALGSYRNEAEARNEVIAHLRSLNPKHLVRFETLLGSISATDADLRS